MKDHNSPEGYTFRNKDFKKDNFETDLRINNKKIPVYVSLSDYIVNNEQYLVVTLQDMTELKNTQKKLIYNERMASLGQLMAGLAHEINTPLSAIKSSCDNATDALKFFRHNKEAIFADFDQSLYDMLIKTIFESYTMHNVLTTREVRTIKRNLISEFEKFDLPNAEELAELYINLGIYDNIEETIHLATDDKSGKLVELATKLSGILQSLDIIKTAAERANKIVYALRNYSHFNNSAEPTMFNIIKGMETVLTLYHNLTKRGVEIIKNYEYNEEILCYPDELNQIWTNLIHNALDAMNYRGILEITIKPVENYLLISFRDNGSGIDEEHKEMLFDPFFTTKKIGEGTGLGLDIVKRIVERHSGKIEFDSKIGEGTEFRVYIPKISIIR